MLESLELYYYYRGFSYRPVLVRLIILLEMLLLYSLSCFQCFAKRLGLRHFDLALWAHCKLLIKLLVFYVVFEDIVLQQSII